MAEKAEKNQARNDHQAMTDEYVKGATPDQLAEKYNLTAQEVVDIVTKPVEEDATITQAEIDEKEAKKGK